MGYVHSILQVEALQIIQHWSDRWGLPLLNKASDFIGSPAIRSRLPVLTGRQRSSKNTARAEKMLCTYGNAKMI